MLRLGRRGRCKYCEHESRENQDMRYGLDGNAMEAAGWQRATFEDVFTPVVRRVERFSIPSPRSCGSDRWTVSGKNTIFARRQVYIVKIPMLDNKSRD